MKFSHFFFRCFHLKLPRGNRNNTDGNEALKKKKLSTCFRALGKHFDGSFSPKRATKTSKIGKFPPFIHPPHQFLHPNTHLGCMLALRVPGISRDPDQHKAVTEDE